MTTLSPHRVVLASAGTGKTFSLTSRFIAHLAALNDPGECSGLLAATFTRKAAAEILAKVLDRIAAAAEDPEKLGELCEHAGVELSRERCAELLAGLAGNLHRLNVLTLDALFLKMASAFSLELGVPPGWRIGDEQEDADLRSEAIGRALEEGEPAELLALLEMLHGGGFSRSVHESILRAVENAYEAYVLSEGREEVWRAIGPRGDALPPERLEGAIRALAGAPVATLKSGEPDGRWVKALEGNIEAARAGEWERFLGGGLAAKALDGTCEFYKKPFPAGLAERLRPLIDHAGAVLLERLRRRNVAVHALMERFDRAYTELKRRRGVYRFDDIPRLLLGRAASGDLEHLYYRLDATIRHVLLDEFQDTSVTQFRLLEPILAELLSADDGRSVFCVGDVKQSLYVWRDAEPSLLPALPKRWAQLVPSTLEKSYRSSAVITDTVNHVFEDLPNNGALAGRAGVTAEWASGFRSHSAAKRIPGAAALVVAPEGEEQAIATARFAAERVAEITRRAPWATVGVLVRTNRQIPRLIFELKAAGVTASEEGGNPLMDAPPVAAAVSLLHLADHPGDTAAYYHVATSPIGEAVGLRLPIDERRARRVSSRVRAKMMDDGCAGMLRWVLGRCGAAMDARGFARFGQLIDLAQAFDARPDTRPGEFVRLVREQGVEEPGRRPVRVMSIHKSKGLEFDAVVLPDLEKPWRLRPGQVLVSRPDPFGPIEAVSVYAEERLRMLDPRLAELHGRCEDRLVAEELCCLYVAMTRAVHHLEMIVAPSEKSDPPLSAAGVLRSALAPGVPAAPEAELWRSHPFEDWAAVAPPGEPEPGEPETVEIRLRPGAASPIPRWRRVSPSSLEGDGGLTVAEALSLEGGGARDRGSLIHAWFELIEWLDSGPPDERELLAAAQRLGFDPVEAAEHAKAFRASLAGDVAAALRRARYAGRAGTGTIEVRREWSFAVPLDDGDGKVIEVGGQFDRLVIGRAGQTPIWAEIIDFKTDRVRPSDGERFVQRVRHYEPQLRAYRRAVTAIFGLEPARIDAALAFTESDTLVPVVG